MSLKHLGAFGVAFLLVLNLTYSSAQADQLTSSDFVSEDFVQEVKELRLNVYTKKKDVCLVPMRDYNIKIYSKYQINLGYEDKYTVSWCYRMDNVLAAINVFLDGKWNPANFEGVTNDYAVEDLKPYELVTYIRGHKEFRERSERTLRIFNRGVNDLPDEFDDYAQTWADLHTWASTLEFDVLAVQDDAEELRLAWDEHIAEEKHRITTNWIGNKI